MASKKKVSSKKVVKKAKPTTRTVTKKITKSKPKKAKRSTAEEVDDMVDQHNAKPPTSSLEAPELEEQATTDMDIVGGEFSDEGPSPDDTSDSDVDMEVSDDDMADDILGEDDDEELD